MPRPASRPAPELYFAIQDTADSRNAKTGRIAKGFMAFVLRSKDGEQPGEDTLIARLRQLVEGSDLSFYKIASRVGTSGTTLSMWLAGTAKPHPEELARIEKLGYLAERDPLGTDPKSRHRLPC